MGLPIGEVELSQDPVAIAVVPNRAEIVHTHHRTKAILRVHISHHAPTVTGLVRLPDRHVVQRRKFGGGWCHEPCGRRLPTLIQGPGSVARVLMRDEYTADGDDDTADQANRCCECGNTKQGPNAAGVDCLASFGLLSQYSPYPITRYGSASFSSGASSNHARWTRDWCSISW